MRKFFFLSFLGIFLLDQVSKFFVLCRMYEGESIPVIPGFFNLVSVRNRGAAFGFLNRSDIDWQVWLFLGATIIAGGILYSLMKKTPKSIVLYFAAGYVMGGALGNLVDRFRFRAVVDFLDFYWKDWHWPAFNVADMGICVGAVLILLLAWKNPADTGKKQSEAR